jgi:hypothetical protein
MKSRKSRKAERKLSLQSIALGCTVLAAVLVGTWVLFPTEMKEVAQQLSQVVGIQPETHEAAPLPLLPPEKEAKATVPVKQTEPPPVDITLPASTTETVPLVPTTDSKPAPPPLTCAQATGLLRPFLDGLDKKEYIRAFNLKQPVQKHLDGLKDKLAAKPPAAVRETDDLYTVISNTAHFFRVIGKDNIRLLKTVLEQEQGRLEELAAASYAASIGESCPTDTVQIPFNTAYEYSVFFLNTIGGRSYLFRREARVRLLINYYALLLIDEAGNRTLNAHGTDISGLIQPLIRDMEATNQLARKDEYLTKLHELAERHPVK